MNNKVVVITGARRGLGRTLAQEFAKCGYTVIVNDKEEESELKKLVQEIKESYSVPAFSFFGDISQEETVEALYNMVLSHFSSIDVLINNAAIVTDLPLPERSTERFNETLRNNVTSTYLMSKYFGKLMYDHHKGRIINIASTNGIYAFFPTSIDYDASKAAIINMTHNFAIEYAPYVCVNAVAPGWMRTPMNEQLPEELIAAECDRIYLKRFADPLEVANLVVFLASDRASYINSAIIPIDGGY